MKKFSLLSLTVPNKVAVVATLVTVAVFTTAAAGCQEVAE